MLFVKWRLKLFILYLLLYSTFSLPIGKRPASNEETHGGKRTKSNDDYESCYFSKLRSTELEKKFRPSLISVDESCSGNLISFTELIENTDLKYTRLGAPNEAAVALARGAGEFPDFDNEKVVDEISQRKICPFHRNELSSQWEKSKHVKHKRKTILCCSVPPTLPNLVDHMFLINAVKGAISYIEAKAVLFVNGTLVHVGAPRCQIHRDMIKSSLEIYRKHTAPTVETNNEVAENTNDIPTPLPERAAKTKVKSYKEESDDEDTCEVAEPVKSTFSAFLKALNLPQKCTNRKWTNLKRTSQHTYVTVLNKVYDTTALILGGKSGHEKLKEAAAAKLHVNAGKNFQDKAQQELLQELKLRFYTAESASDRRSYLSLFVEVLPLKVIESVIPDLNPYQYTEAKKMARRSKSHQQKPVRGYKEVVKKSDVEKFVAFFTSFSTGIPFGRIKKRLKNKTVLELPATIRDLRNSKIIQKYKNYMAEKGEEVGMSDSTMIKILKACPAKRKVSLRAVDEQKANGILAFEWMLEIIIDLENKNFLNKDEADDFKTRLTEAEFFFRTDYYMLLTYDHHSADFCITYALSDSRSAEFRADKCHLKKEHLYRTSRAHIFKNLVKELEEVVENIEAGDEEKNLDIANYKITIEESVYAVDQWQSHIVRARFSDDRRALLTELENGDAFITVDFAQRWQPRYYREKQSMYYGKGGNCFSVLHCYSKQSGALVEHVIVHFLGYCDQDYVTVTAIFLDAFEILAKKGVKRIKLRSDNASYYHNPAVIMGMPGIGKKSGLAVERYSFSEAQSGKGICDVLAGFFKGILIDYGHQGNDVATDDQMFDAMNDAIRNGYIDGVTVVKAKKVPKKSDKPKLTIPQLQYVGEFEYGVDDDENDIIKLWKHYNIGKGKIIELPDEAKTLPLQTLEGTTKSDPTPLFWREKTLIFKKPPKEKQEKQAKTTPAPPISTDEIEPLYQCETPGCKDEFLTLENYEKHKLLGRHHLVPVKETVEEKAHELFYEYVTGKETKHNLFVANAMSEADVEMDINEVKPEGWALKKQPRRVKYTSEMEQFLNNEYVNYIKSGRKRFDPYNIQQKMRKSRNPMFDAEQRLSASKITSYFNSRKNKLEALAKEIISKEDEERIRREVNAEFTENLQNDNFDEIPDDGEEEARVIQSVLKKATTAEAPDEMYFEDEDENINEDSEEEEDDDETYR